MVTYLLPLACLTAGLVFQILGSPAAQAPVLSTLGFVLVAVGLGAFARGTQESIGLVLLAWVPVLGALLGLLLVFGSMTSIVLTGKKISVIYGGGSNVPFNAAKGAVHAAILSLMMVALCWPILNRVESGRVIQGTPPDSFPVLVVARAEGSKDYAGYVVFIADLENFRREHLLFSFLVPEGTEASLRSTLRQYNPSAFSHSSDHASPGGDFKVKRVGVDRQSLELRYTGDKHTYVGWYEASAQGIAPKRYALSGYTLGVGLAYFIDILIAIMIYWPIAWALERWLWPRWRTDTANEIGTS